MKQKFKNTKGITLVALIITIIVLLILAVVVITSISKSNIIKHAQNGKEAYEQGKTNETTTLAEYEQYLDDNSNQKVEWGCYKDTERGETTLFYLGSNSKVTIKSTDKLLAYIGDFDENENFVPTTTIENIDITSLKNSSGSEINLKNNTTINKLRIDKEFGNAGDEGETINIDIPYTLEIIEFLEGKENLHFEGNQSLTEIYLPSTIKTITPKCFDQCNKDKVRIYYNGTQEQWNKIDKQMTYTLGITVEFKDKSTIII